jgi:ketol-acid reductoisomerase
MQENDSGRANFLKMRADSQGSQIESVGKGLRAMMPWLHKGKTPVDISA